MMVVWTLLLTLLVMSDGTIVRKEVNECKCEGDDHSEECKEQCEIDTVRRERQINCAAKVIPPNSVCGRHSNATYCNDNDAFVGVPVNSDCYSPDDRCTWLPCCFEAECAISPNYSAPAAGSRPRADNVTLSWIAVNGYLPKLLISWSQAIPVGGYQLFISTTNSTDYKSFYTHLDRCSCLNASIRQYAVEVGQYYRAYIQIKLVSLPVYQSIFEDDSHTVTIVSDIPDCWDLENAYSYKCVLLPSPPQNLTVTGTPVNQSSIMLHMSWRPPVRYNHVILAYSVEIYTAYDDVYHYVNGSTFHYEVILNISTNYEVWVSASNSNEVTENNEFCYLVGKGYDVPSNTYCWGDEASLTVNNSIFNTTPTLTYVTTETHPNTTILVATLSGGASLLLLLTMIIMLLVCRTCLYKRTNVYSPLRDVTSLTPSPITSAKVFIINSSQSTNEDLRLVRHLCHNLAEHEIEPITYEYSMCESGPEQSGIYHWMEHNFTECDMTLFVCNKCFYDAWNSNVTEQDAIVSASKQLLQGHLTTSGNISKLGVVLLREHDRQYIPSLYLKNLTTFSVFGDGQCDDESLVRYILQVPKFIRPSVAMTLTALPENTV